MIDKLQTYLAELQANADAIAAEDHTAEIETAVANFKADLEDKYAQDKAARLAKVASDMDCLQNIITREQEKLAATLTVDTAIGG